MDEAVEICKLRLFLKMVAQLEDVKRIEPLPDIDFNIQAGNTLVGYATYNEVEKAVTGKLDFDDTMQRIQESAEDVDQLFTLFRQQQTELGGTVTPAEKQALQDKLSVLEARTQRIPRWRIQRRPEQKNGLSELVNFPQAFPLVYCILRDS